MTYGPSNSQGQFLDYTITIPDDSIQMNLKLTDSYQQIASAVNNREISVYSKQELPNGMQYFNNADTQLFRNVYRKVLDFVELNGGNLAASTNYNFAHDISDVYESALIYANCTSTTGFRFTLVYPNVWVDATNAYFNNVALQLSQCDIIIQVLKN